MSDDLDTQPNVDSEILYEESYKRVLPELEALPAEQVAHVNLEPMVAVSVVLGTLPELQSFRAELMRRLPDFDLPRFDKLEDYAMALAHAHTMHLVAQKPPDDLRVLHAEGVALCERLRSDAEALFKRGLIEPMAPKALEGTVGHRNLANDLQVLGRHLTDSLPAVEEESAIQATELERAMLLSARILRSLGLREQSPGASRAASNMRARAFTLLVSAYENARRAISYLRWKEGDVDAIIPSLYANRGGGRRRAAPDAEAEPGEESPSQDTESSDLETTLPAVGIIQPQALNNATPGPRAAATPAGSAALVASLRGLNGVPNPAGDPTGAALSPVASPETLTK